MVVLMDKFGDPIQIQLWSQLAQVDVTMRTHTDPKTLAKVFYLRILTLVESWKIIRSILGGLSQVAGKTIIRARIPVFVRSLEVESRLKNNRLALKDNLWKHQMLYRGTRELLTLDLGLLASASWADSFVEIGHRRTVNMSELALNVLDLEHRAVENGESLDLEGCPNIDRVFSYMVATPFRDDFSSNEIDACKDEYSSLLAGLAREAAWVEQQVGESIPTSSESRAGKKKRSRIDIESLRKKLMEIVVANRDKRLSREALRERLNISHSTFYRRLCDDKEFRTILNAYEGGAGRIPKGQKDADGVDAFAND